MEPITIDVNRRGCHRRDAGDCLQGSFETAGSDRLQRAAHQPREFGSVPPETLLFGIGCGAPI